MKDKKAAKKIIRLAKEHPGWYTKQDVLYAKMVKKRIKQEKQAQKEDNTEHEEIYNLKLEDAHRLADEYKGRIQDIFQSTFSA